MKRLNEKEFKVTDGKGSKCNTKLYALLDAYGSIKLKVCHEDGTMKDPVKP